MGKIDISGLADKPGYGLTVARIVEGDAASERRIRLLTVSVGLFVLVVAFLGSGLCAILAPDPLTRQSCLTMVTAIASAFAGAVLGQRLSGSGS